jgi:hypothetical protein
MGFCKGYFFDSEETKIKYNNRLHENDFDEYDNLSTMNLDDYYTIVERAWCFQTTWERLMKDIFYKNGEYTSLGELKIRPASGFQYSGKPWYAQVFVGSNWGFTSDASGTYHAMVGNRPPSGDEEWIMAWTPIVLGAKGLIYDREQTTPDGRELDDNYIDYEWMDLLYCYSHRIFHHDQVQSQQE